MIPEPIADLPDPKPWIGSAYLRQPRRVLVVGESHKMSDGAAPIDGSDLREYTVRAVSVRIAGEDAAPFWANIEQAMFSEPDRLHQAGDGIAEIKARSDFWHSVAFINFFPRVMDSQTDRPQAGEHAAATRRLAATILALEPELVCIFSSLATGARPHGEAPDYNGFGAPPEAVAGQEDLWRYRRPGGGATLVAAFPHPSRAGFGQARERYQQLVAALGT